MLRELKQRGDLARHRVQQYTERYTNYCTDINSYNSNCTRILHASRAQLLRDENTSSACYGYE
ncbi:hypothetical protein D3C77_788740 [compost metagenome]